MHFKSLLSAFVLSSASACATHPAPRDATSATAPPGRGGASVTQVANVDPAGAGAADQATSVARPRVLPTDIFDGVSSGPGGAVHLESGVFDTTVTHNVKSNWTLSGNFGSYLDGGRVRGGTTLSWHGGAAPVLRYQSTEFTRTSGMSIDCNGVLGSTGVLVESDNKPAAHHNYFQDFTIENCPTGISINSGKTVGSQSDAWRLENFQILNSTGPFFVANSQNCCQTSEIAYGGFFQRIPNSHNSMIDFSGRSTPYNMTIRYNAFGSAPGYTGAAIDLSQNTNSGGAPLILEGNEFELLGHASSASREIDWTQSPDAVRATTDDRSGGVIVLLGQAINGGGNVNITGKRNVVSIGNTHGPGGARVSNPLSTLISIGDSFNRAGYEASCVGTAGCVILNQASSGAPVVPLHVARAGGELAVFEALGNAWLTLRDSGANPSEWKLQLRGATAGGATGDLDFYDQRNGRALLQLSRDRGSVAIGSCATGPTGGPGDLSVCGNLETSGNLAANRLNVSADVEIRGTQSTVVPVSGGKDASLGPVESPGRWFEDFGSAKLDHGTAHVEIDPTFAEVANTDAPYHLFVTPKGDCGALYVASQTARAFEVKESRGGSSNVEFDYRIIARRRGYETARFTRGHHAKE